MNKPENPALESSSSREIVGTMQDEQNHQEIMIRRLQNKIIRLKTAHEEKEAKLTAENGTLRE